MKTFLYIHGYGSTGQAMKAQLLQVMFPEARVVAPTLDYDHVPPCELFRQLQETVAQERPHIIVGSSMGGYYALCCTRFFQGPVWCINPVHDVVSVIRRLAGSTPPPDGQERLRQYEDFDREVFQQLRPADGQIRLALSTDDELLGDHRPLLDRFPNHGTVVWKDHCGHRFLRFDELKDYLNE